MRQRRIARCAHIGAAVLVFHCQQCGILLRFRRIRLVVQHDVDIHVPILHQELVVPSLQPVWIRFCLICIPRCHRIQYLIAVLHVRFLDVPQCIQACRLRVYLHLLHVRHFYDHLLIQHIGLLCRPLHQVLNQLCLHRRIIAAYIYIRSAGVQQMQCYIVLRPRVLALLVEFHFHFHFARNHCEHIRLAVIQQYARTSRSRGFEFQRRIVPRLCLNIDRYLIILRSLDRYLRVISVDRARTLSAARTDRRSVPRVICAVRRLRYHVQRNVVVDLIVLLILHAHYRVPVRHVKLIHSARRRFVFLFDPFPDHCQRRLVSGLYLYVYLH